MKHHGNYTTAEGGYGATFELEDGTLVNFVTIFTGPGLAACEEIEAARPLTQLEIEMVSDADSSINHAQEPQIEHRPVGPVQHRL
jgi:hypothetical protein